MRCLQWPSVFLTAGFLLLACFGLAGKELATKVRPKPGAELEISLPVIAQLVMAGGDRFLAANLGVFRALVASTDAMTAADFSLQGQIQSDAAWLNPAHEDNYYIAAAILPWYGQFDAAQLVLHQATDARPFDWQPPFYYAFNVFYFQHDPLEAARWLRRASAHTDVEENILAFQQIAALWAAKGSDLKMAIGLHQQMMAETKHREFSAFLAKRVARLENLLQIEIAMEKFQRKNGRSVSNVDQLVREGFLDAMPVDPFGLHYQLNKDGRPAAKLVQGVSKENQ